MFSTSRYTARGLFAAAIALPLLAGTAYAQSTQPAAPAATTTQPAATTAATTGTDKGTPAKELGATKVASPEKKAAATKSTGKVTHKATPASAKKPLSATKAKVTTPAPKAAPTTAAPVSQ